FGPRMPIRSFATILPPPRSNPRHALTPACAQPRSRLRPWPSRSALSPSHTSHPTILAEVALQCIDDDVSAKIAGGGRGQRTPWWASGDHDDRGQLTQPAGVS